MTAQKQTLDIYVEYLEDSVEIYREKIDNAIRALHKFTRRVDIDRELRTEILNAIKDLL